MLDALFRKRYGNPVWDSVLRLTGLVALLAIPMTVYLPGTGGMVGFALVTIWVNGPVSPLLPSTYEPILMLTGRLYPALLVATVGTAGTIYVEYLNYHLYRRVLQMSMLDKLRESRTIERVVRLFRKAPFFTVWLCSWSLIPYWTVRFISPLAGYDLTRHLTATFLGRFPRLWFFAALGAWWNVSVWVLVAISLASIALALTVYAVRRSRGKSADDQSGFATQAS